MRYIHNVYRDHGWYAISGVIGWRRYLYYTKREAMRKYNQEAKEKAVRA